MQRLSITLLSGLDGMVKGHARCHIPAQTSLFYVRLSMCVYVGGRGGGLCLRREDISPAQTSPRQ